MTHPMEPLGDMNQVKSRFSLFGDSVSVDARLVHGLCHGTIQIIRAEVQKHNHRSDQILTLEPI
jgi:hypothetical protein